MNPSVNLILGAAVGYDWPTIAPFVRSLRRSGCRARVVLLVGRVDAATRRGFAENAIDALGTQPIVRWLPPHLARKRFNRYWLGWLHRGLPHLIGASASPTSPRTALLARAAACFHHPACSRYFAYFRYLRPRLADFDQVLTTDVRDVVFQADPFSTPAGNGSVFLEHNAVHGQEPGNDRWIEMGFGSDGLAQMRGRRVTCSGLTLAPAPLMLAYLAAMTRELALRTDRLTGHDGVDQGVHNWLFWTGKLANFVAVENFAGPVLTMHGLPPSMLRRDTQGRLINSDGSAIPVLHQYDRHPEFATLFKEKLTALG